MRRCLTVENIKHFVERFLNFQSHWPLIHIPSFDPIEAHDGLLLAIICIGAVYSNKRDMYQIRALMVMTNDAIKKNSRICRVMAGLQSDEGTPLGTLPTDYEELVALKLLTTIFVWHGNQVQRAAAQRDFDGLVAIVRRMSLFNPAPRGNPFYSMLHQPGEIPQSSLQAWDWQAWVRQEGRSRTLFAIFLLDAALCLYFNKPPQFDPLEIRLPLPADDAAWEAQDGSECANALGLHGPHAQVRNATGSQRPRQPDMESAMRSLLNPQYEFQLRATNVYSKFILIHALTAQVWKVQRGNLQQSSGAQGVISPFDHRDSSTPLSPYDWTATTNGASKAVPIHPKV